jgi:integrase/recombinase XerD
MVIPTMRIRLLAWLARATLEPEQASAVQSEESLVVAGDSPADLGPVGASEPDPVGLYLAQLRSPKSRTTAIDCLRRVLRVLGKDPNRWRETRWATLTVEHTTALDRLIGANYKPAVQRLTRAVVRGVIGACWRLGMIDGDRRLRLTDVGCWPRIRAETVPIGRALETTEIRVLRDYCNRLPPFRAAYVWGIFVCALGAGLRRDEIANLKVDALSDDARYLLVTGKGRKERLQPLPGSTGAAMEAWLAQRARLPLTTEAMFPRFRGDGELIDKTITSWGVWRIIRNAQQAAGCAPFTPHDLRRTYATYWIRKDGLSTAQRFMRHKDPKTTAIYDRRPDDELFAKVNAIEELFG